MLTEKDQWMVVTNPAAGGASPGLADEVAELCREWAPDTRPLWTEAPRHAVRLVAEAVRERETAVVVVVGGDGTAREVAEGLAAAGTGTALLTVPAGTGNSFHRAIWGDSPWRYGLDEFAAGRSRVRRLDLMRVAGSDTVVLLGAATGFIAAVTESARAFGDVTGRDRYLRAMAQLVEQPPIYDGRVLVDGAVVHDGPTLTVAVGGARHRVGMFEILPESVLDDGLLDICVIDGRLTPAQRQELIPRVVAGQHHGTPGVHHARGTRVTVERSDGSPLAFEHDGEVWPRRTDAITLEALPGVLPVLAPPHPVAG